MSQSDQIPPAPVTAVGQRDISDLLQVKPRQHPSMHGFDSDYADIVDYIIRCTHRMWEEKDVGLIEDHYGEGVEIFTLAGYSRGIDAVVEGTTKTLAAFPDRSLCGETVIWCHKNDNGFLSSHRIISHMTNSGNSEFGPASGKRATVTTIADCLVRANRIVEEWLVRDNLSLVMQLGMDHRAVARRLAGDISRQRDYRDWRERQIDAALSCPAAAVAAAPAAAGSDPEAFARQALEAIWNRRRFGAVRDIYSPTCLCYAPSGRVLFGHGEIIGYIISLLGALPDARLNIDHICATPGDGGSEIAVRWYLAGHHHGDGIYGAPSGHRVLIMAVTHWQIVDDKIAAEWTVFDELAVLRQIYGGA